MEFAVFALIVVLGTIIGLTPTEYATSRYLELKPMVDDIDVMAKSGDGEE